MNMGRPGWDRYFLDLCEAVAKRATCDRGSGYSIALSFLFPR